MKATRLTVRPINKRSGLLPDDTLNCTLLLIATQNGRVSDRRIYQNNPTMMNEAPHGFTHYIILPNYILT